MNTQWQHITSLATYPEQLPVNDVLEAICTSLMHQHQLVLKAPPGAGKTSLLPLALMTQPWAQGSKILVLEPRRLAAKSSAIRMAAIIGEKVGERIGYSMRNESKVSKATVVEVITEGLLTRLLQDDPALQGVSAIVFDEFHERNLNSDLGLALALQSADYFRDDAPLRLIVMSATLEGIDFSKALPNAPVLESLGRQFPVDVFYAQTLALHEYLAPPMAQLIYKAIKETEGSILVFLPGQKEINQLQKLLQNNDSVADAKVQILPLYGSLSLDQQWQAIEPLAPNSPFKRKVVLATDIAETSLTIEGISAVVDSGLCRVSVFDPQTAMSSLHTKRISEASSIQRAGRAGRLSSGVCYRLWGESTQASLAKQSVPEVLQADLLDLSLQLFCWGVSQPDELTWLDAPPVGLFAQASDLLLGFSALREDDSGRRSITEHGQLMNQLPTHPRLAHMLLMAVLLDKHRQDKLKGKSKGEWIKKACAISCLISERDPLHYLNADLDKRVDVLLSDMKVERRYDAWLRRNQFQMKQLSKKLAAISSQICDAQFETMGIDLSACDDISEYEQTAFLLSVAFPDRVGKRSNKKGRYKLSNGQTVSFHDNDTMSEQAFIIVAQSGGAARGFQHNGQKNNDAFIFAAAAMSESCFKTVYQYQLIEKTSLYWDERKARFMAEQQVMFRQLCLKATATQDISVDEKREALLSLLKSKGLNLLNWNNDAVQLQSRVQLAHSLQQSKQIKHQDVQWPIFDEYYLLDHAESWLAHHLDAIKTLQDFKKINVETALQTLLPWPMMQQLDALLPKRYKVASGAHKAIDYQQSPPVLAVKLQEMFGMQDTPSVAQGVVPLLVHLLSPAGKPLQVTQDLASFWRGSYDAVKKEMKGKYPRHPWPDDPLSFEATALTKRRLANKK